MIKVKDYVPNDYGIHLCSCKGVVISDCNISGGDDCIALSGITNWEKPCEDVVITNCVLRSCSKAIVIGYIYSVVRNCLIMILICMRERRKVFLSMEMVRPGSYKNCTV